MNVFIILTIIVFNLIVSYFCSDYIEKTIDYEAAHFDVTLEPPFPVNHNSWMKLRVQFKDHLKNLNRFFKFQVYYENEVYYEIDLRKVSMKKVGYGKKFVVESYKLDVNEFYLTIKARSKYHGEKLELMALDKTNSNNVRFYNCQFIVIPTNDQLSISTNASKGYMLVDEYISVTCFWSDYMSYLTLNAKNFSNHYKKDSKIHVVGHYKPKFAGRNFGIICKADISFASVNKSFHIDVFRDENDYFWQAEFGIYYILKCCGTCFCLILLSVLLIISLMEMLRYISKID